VKRTDTAKEDIRKKPNAKNEDWPIYKKVYMTGKTDHIKNTRFLENRPIYFLHSCHKTTLIGQNTTLIFCLTTAVPFMLG
jgi:hypothetical protein